MMTSSCHLPFVLPRLPQFQLASLPHVTFPFSYLVSDKLPYYLLKPALRDWVEIAIIQNQQILLTQRADLPVWCLPGGTVEAHESLAQAAIRETVEETGLSVELTRIVGVYSRPQWGEGAHVILFAAHPVGGTLLTTTNETVAAGFFAPNALPSTLLWWYHQRIADAFANRTAVAWTQNVEWPWGNASRAEMYQRLLRGEFILADVVAQLCRMPTAGQENLDILTPPAAS